MTTSAHTASRRSPMAAASLRFTGALGIGIALLLVSGPAVGGSSGTVDAIDAYVRSTVDAWAVPGASIAVVRDGEVVHLAALGTATADGRPMTTATPIVIGSVGKSITALAVRQLVAAGRLDADAPVTRYVPWFALDGPATTTQLVTIGRLLDHTSGLSTHDGQDPRWYEAGLTPADVVRGMASMSLDRPPGSYEYSNLNYVLLGVVVEAASGQGYGDYVQEHIFRPLGMTGSSTSMAAIAGSAGLASGHRYLYGVPVPFTEPYPTAIVPAGYQIASADDMAQFVAALANGGVHDGVDIVTGERLARPEQALGTDWQPLVATGPGLTVNQSGATLSTNANILVEPASHFGVVVLMNANPIQFLGLPGGAADVAFGIARLSHGADPTSTEPSVRVVYLVVDGLLVLLAALLVVHLARARTWSIRLGRTRHRRLFLARAIIADGLLPLAVLVGLPLAIGAIGSTSPGDVIAGWRFVLWTLPDIAVAVLTLSIVPLVVGVLKVANQGPLHRRAVPAAGSIAAVRR